MIALMPVVYFPGKSCQLEHGLPMDGLPIAPVDKIRIAYTCNAPFGLGKVVMHYRVIKTRPAPMDGGAAETEITPWFPLVLIEKAGTEDSGPFLLDKGTFLNS